MTAITKFTLKDVRCFEGTKEFNIRPLTFLVGENSTGKSTMLGCFQTLSDFVSNRSFKEINFNDEPYQMGAFTDIVRKTQSCAETFELGFVGGEVGYHITWGVREGLSEPVIHNIRINSPDGEIIGRLAERDGRRQRFALFGNIHIEKKEKDRFVFSFDDEFVQFLSGVRNSTHILMELMAMQMKENGGKIPSDYKKMMTFWERYARKREGELDLLQHATRFITDSFAPIRSKPARTYNPLREIASPEGSEMPMVLMNLSISNKEGWKRLKKQLEAFGKESGLFTYIGVRTFGRPASDPFQLQIKVRGPKGNIMDVGYGVSQILPILVRVLSDRSGGRFLLQQPEVHLHPRGQAALTSLLIDGVKRKPRGQKFIVETHSDYMIDRARIEIMQGNIKPQDVSLIYLEPTGNNVRVHNITFDENANMHGEPQHYRDFFLKETNKLLGFKD